MERSGMGSDASYSDVVVVDDDARVRNMILLILGHAGLAARGYGGPLEALDQVLARPPAVLVTDLQMPELDGVGLASAVRAELGARSPRILLVTGSPRAVRARDKHLFDLIVGKPWDRDVLVDAVLPWVRASIPPLAAAG